MWDRSEGEDYSVFARKTPFNELDNQVEDDGDQALDAVKPKVLD